MSIESIFAYISSNSYVYYTISILAMVFLSWFSYFIIKLILINWVTYVIHKTEAKWDDYLLQNKVFRKITLLVPGIVIYLFSYALQPSTKIIQKITSTYLIIIVLVVIDAVINTISDLYEQYFPKANERPIKSYLAILKIFIFVVGFISIVSNILSKSPLFFLSGIGAMTAVLLLVFKNTILSFIASIQITMNHMVKIGDWIEMPQYGADGNVIDIALHTIKVQNWDKTIITIPTHKLIEESFKNWKGMKDCGGRRIKRSIFIDLNSIKICSNEDIEKYKKFHLIESYIMSKMVDIKEYNHHLGIDLTERVNGRNITNIGTYRAYINEYLKNNSLIKKDMTFLIRHLEPGEYGLPIEVYVFADETNWAKYEAIQADIFDHLLAVAREFDLKLFQSPSGNTFNISQ